MKILLEELADWCIWLIGWIPGRSGRLLRGLYYRAMLAGSGKVLSIGRDVEIGCPRNITVGSEIYLVDGSILRACGDSKLTIGNRFALNGNARIIADHGSIKIGHGVMIGPNTVIRASNHTTARTDMDIWQQAHTGGSITIGDDVWIGANVVIVAGVTIGSHVVVAAGAVVTRDIADYVLAAGVPARSIRDRRTPDPDNASSSQPAQPVSTD